MSKKTVAIVGAALVFVLFFIYSTWPDDDGAGMAGARETNAPENSVAEEQTAETPTVAAEERHEVDETEEPEDSEQLRALAPYEFELEVVARTVDDLPGSDVSIHLAPEYHPLNRTTTDEKGVAKIRWRGRQPSTTIVYSSPKDLSGGKLLRRVAVSAGTKARVAVRVQSTAPRNGVVRLSFGNGQMLRGYTVNGGEFELVASNFVRASGRGVKALHRDREGWSWFVAGRPDPGDSKRQTTLSANSFTISGINGMQFARIGMPNQNDQPRRKRTVTGTIRDAKGRPVEKALVIVAGKRTRTNKAGKYTLEIKARDADLIPGRAGGGDHGLATGEILVGSETGSTWDARLDRGIELTGQLLTPDGEPLAGWRVEIEPVEQDEEMFVDGTTTDKEGRFAIPNVIDRGYRLRAFAPKCVLPSLHTTDLHPRQFNVLALKAPHHTGTFQAKPRDVDGNPVVGLDMRLWDDEHGEGRVVRPARSGRDAKPQAVVAGRYRLVIGAASHASADMTEVQIAAGQLNELGEVTLGPPTTLDVTAAKKGLRVFRLHETVASRIDVDKNRVLRVPPGTYRALLSGNEIEFEVATGVNTAPAAVLEK